MRARRGVRWTGAGAGHGTPSARRPHRSHGRAEVGAWRRRRQCAARRPDGRGPCARAARSRAERADARGTFLSSGTATGFAARNTSTPALHTSTCGGRCSGADEGDGPTGVRVRGHGPRAMRASQGRTGRQGNRAQLMGAAAVTRRLTTRCPHPACSSRSPRPGRSTCRTARRRRSATARRGLSPSSR